MIKIILQLKSWQIGVPVLSLFVIPMLFDPFLLVFYEPFVILFTCGVWAAVFLWYYALGIGFIGKTSKDIPPAIKSFKRYFFLCILSACLIFLTAFSIGKNGDLLWLNFWIVFLLALCYLGSVGTMFAKTARAISSWEINGDVGLGYSAGNFFLLWFFPVGIWLIQPKANKMIRGETGPFQVRNEIPSAAVRSEYCCSHCGADANQGQEKCQICGEPFE